MSTDQLKRRLEEMALELGEHCDSVRIFVTLPTEQGISVALDSGVGNLYAQLGQVREWLCIQEQYQRNWAIRNDQDDEAT